MIIERSSLLTLTRIEGLLFRPMALTLYSPLSAPVLRWWSPVLATALSARLSRVGKPVAALGPPRVRCILAGLLRVRWLVVVASATLLAGVFTLIVPRLGTEFLPYMDEGVIWVRANFPEGASLQQTVQFGRRLREVALEFPDVQFIAAQSGRNDSGTDPFPPSRIEMMIGPQPREQWRQFKTKQALVAALEHGSGRISDYAV
jgi:cobalt-zinc-cadmium resistance protein CzcA